MGEARGFLPGQLRDALGERCSITGYRVRCTLATKLVNELVEATDEKQLIMRWASHMLLRSTELRCVRGALVRVSSDQPSEQTLQIALAVTGLGAVGQPAADQPLGGGANELIRPGVVLPQEPLGQVLGDDGALGRRDHPLGQGGDVAGEAVDDAVEFVSGNGPVDPAEALRGFGVLEVGAQHRLQGAIAADPAGEVLRAPSTGDDAHESLDLADAGATDRRHRPGSTRALPDRNVIQHGNGLGPRPLPHALGLPGGRGENRPAVAVRAADRRHVAAVHLQLTAHRLPDGACP
ncbi:hypothetical protein Spla01_06907 [Streptomyces platensis]